MYTLYIFQRDDLCENFNLLILDKNYAIVPSLTVERVKSGYKPSKYGQCSHFLSCIDMCYFSVLFTTFVFLMIVRMEVLVMIS